MNVSLHVGLFLLFILSAHPTSIFMYVVISISSPVISVSSKTRFFVYGRINSQLIMGIK